MAAYIEREKLPQKKERGSYLDADFNAGWNACLNNIENIPAADARPVVLCRDCIFRSNEWTGCPKLNGTITGDEFFCKCGIKREGS